MYIEGEVPVVGTNNNGMGFGNGWEGLIGLALVAGLFDGGFGNFGGNRGGNYSGIGENYALITDVATLERKMDTLANGICDSTFALNNTITNGFANVQNTLCQGFSGVNLALSTQGYETRNAIAGVSSQLASCCCDIEKSLLENRYIDAQNTCAITNAINGAYRALHDEIVANRMEDKNAQIMAQQNEINALRLKASQEAQNSYLIKQLKPCPVSAYVDQPPQQVTFPTNCCGSVAYANYNNNCCGC